MNFPTFFSYLSAAALFLTKCVTGQDYGQCQLLPFPDIFAFGSEDLQEWEKGIFLVSAGVEGPAGLGQPRPPQPYTNGAIYALVFPKFGSVPELAPLSVTGLPSPTYLSDINFRPHGISIEGDLLFVVSHNEDDTNGGSGREENIVIFEIKKAYHGDVPIELEFRVVLASDQWNPVGRGIENWHLNSIAVVSKHEILVTQFGPLDQNNIPAGLTTKTLWSCKLDKYLLSKGSKESKVVITCEQAVDFFNFGMNGIAINDDKNKVWVVDSFQNRLVTIERSKEGVYTEVGQIALPGVGDNIKYIDGDLSGGLFTTEFSLDPNDLIGGYIMVEDAEDDNAVATLAYQLDTSFLTQVAIDSAAIYGIPVPFLVSSAIPYKGHLIFGSFVYPGVVVCEKLNGFPSKKSAKKSHHKKGSIVPPVLLPSASSKYSEVQ